MTPVAFPHQPFHAVARCIVSQLFPGGEADFSPRPDCRKDIKHQIPIRPRTPAEINFLEHPLASQYASLGKFQHKCRNLILPRRPSGRELLSALLAAPFQDETAALRLHALAEAVRDLAVMLVRLICTLQLDSSSPISSFIFREMPPFLRGGHEIASLIIDYAPNRVNLIFRQKLLIHSCSSDKISVVYLEELSTFVDNYVDYGFF